MLEEKLEKSIVQLNYFSMVKLKQLNLVPLNRINTINDAAIMQMY